MAWSYSLRLDPCVHCGFCLPACPTYLVTGDEGHSPRGRIVLMRALERGEMGADDPALVEHLDACLGCRGCEPACPSGWATAAGWRPPGSSSSSTRPLALARSVLGVFRYAASGDRCFTPGSGASGHRPAQLVAGKRPA